MQTFWKNKHIDRVLTYMNEAYSDGKFESNEVYFRGQLMTCYRFDQRFSHIPNPNLLVLPIIATHVHVLMFVAINTLLDRRNESIDDCFKFHDPYEVLQCENNIDPCRVNNTENIPKCTYYYF
ncbi:unnamed protein product [Rotaria sp. Silwood2]|nr:unnamed protein product [Rotaria sp. Silwood2]CAF4493564.1 unnamed protein product [Rotaria sp. Silwood2]